MLRFNVSLFISKSMIFKYQPTALSLFIALLIVIPIQEIFAFNFKDQIQERSPKTFKHWNKKKKKVTGFTKLTFETEKGTGYLLEISKNLDQDQNVFSQKTLWFDPSTGELKKYEEKDFRTDMKTLNSYDSKTIHTQIWEKEKKTDINLQIQPDLVPFEVLSHFLQSKIPEIQKEHSIQFTLYLPVIAFELANKGLPLSLSQLGMKATVTKIKTKNTIFGKRETITIRVEPTSFFVRALLSNDKSKFDFTFVNQQPFSLLLFEEGSAQSILSNLN